MKTFHYTVNDEPQTTTDHVLTVVTILRNAGFDPASHYLVQIDGNHRVSYQDKPDEAIHMHEHMKFLAISIAPTPVS